MCQVWVRRQVLSLFKLSFKWSSSVLQDLPRSSSSFEQCFCYELMYWIIDTMLIYSNLMFRLGIYSPNLCTLIRTLWNVLVLWSIRLVLCTMLLCIPCFRFSGVLQKFGIRAKFVIVNTEFSCRKIQAMTLFQLWVGHILGQLVWIKCTFTIVIRSLITYVLTKDEVRMVSNGMVWEYVQFCSVYSWVQFVLI